MQPASPRQTLTPAPDLRPALLHPSSERLFISVARRMAIFGIDDAQCVSTLLTHFGSNYRRPLILTRALMVEIARTSQRKILLAPPCCARITTDEGIMLRALQRSEADSAGCHVDACTLLGRDNALGAMTGFQAVSQAFADLGHPFG